MTEWSEFSHGPQSQICGTKAVYTLILSPDRPSPVNGRNLLKNKMRSMGLACLPTRTWMVDVSGKLVGISDTSPMDLNGRRKHVEFSKNTCHWWWVWYVNWCHFEASNKTPSFPTNMLQLNMDGLQDLSYISISSPFLVAVKNQGAGCFLDCRHGGIPSVHTHRDPGTPPKFNSSPLRNDGWKISFLLGWPIF